LRAALAEHPKVDDFGRAPSVHEVGAGKFYEEEKYRALNMRMFDQAPVVTKYVVLTAWSRRSFQTGPFGTFDDPVPILSNFNNRVVGCLGIWTCLFERNSCRLLFIVGGGHHIHDLMWFQIDGDRKHMCEHCGQFFKLYTLADEEDFKKLSEKDIAAISKYYDGKMDLPVDERGAEKNVLAAFHPHPEPEPGQKGHH
jgi:hypothetical protein